MAISVSGLTVHTQTGGGTWTDYGSGGGSSSTTANFYSSTSARGRKFSGVKGMAYEVNASGTNLANSIIVIRFFLAGGFAATRASAGGVIRLQDTSGNQSDWYVTGSDVYQGGWSVVIIDTANTESANNGTAATLSAIRYVGMEVNANGGSGGDPNFYIDEVLTLPNTGLTLAGNTTNLFSELAAWDVASLYGVVDSRSGVVFSKCPLILSPDASDHASTDEILVFEEPVYYDSSNIDSALTITGMSSADSDTITLTRLNAICYQNSAITGTSSDKSLDFSSATDIVADTCTFRNFNGTTMALGGSGNSYDDCSFQGCAQITDTGAVVRRGFVRNTACASTEGALLWTTSSDWEDTEFIMGSSNHHAMNITSNITDNWNGFTFTGYSTSTGPTSVGNEVLINNASGGTVTINAIGVTGKISFRENGTSSTVVNSTVTVKITVRDVDDLAAVSSARVLMEAASGGDLPSKTSVSITRSGSTATVTHTAHGMLNGQQVVIRNANEQEYNGIFTITNVTANTYDYTVSGSPASPATGSITSAAVILTGTTDGSGVLQTSTFNYTSDQPVTGVVRHGTSGSLYKTGSITGLITNIGLDTTVLLSDDD